MPKPPLPLRFIPDPDPNDADAASKWIADASKHVEEADEVQQGLWPSTVDILERCEPRILLAAGCATLVLLRTFGQETVLNQHHFELLQALVLQFGRGSARGRLTPEAFQRVLFTLIAISRRDEARNSEARSPLAQDPGQKRSAMLRELQDDTRTLRNWGDFDTVTQVAAQIVQPVEQLVAQELGLSPSALVQMWVTVIRETSVQMQQSVMALAGQASVQGAIKTLHAELRQDLLRFEDDPEQVLQFRALKRLLATDELLLEFVPNLTLLAGSFAAAYPGPVSEDALCRALDHWSLKYGQVHVDDPRLLLYENPIWRRPLIKLEQYWYFLPLPQLIQSFFFPLLEHLFDLVPNLVGTFKQRRGDALESLLMQVAVSPYPAPPSIGEVYGTIRVH